jgi:3-hexulose-6-phosphate synthase
MTLLQIAFDLIATDDAVALLPRLAPFVDVVEAGTPLIKREGIGAVRRLRAAAPEKQLVADMKTMDGGAYEAELAFGAGADLMTVLGCASDATVAAAIAVARDRGKRVVADLIGVVDKPVRVRRLAQLGVDFLGVHAGTDERGAGGEGPLWDVAMVQEAVATPLVVAGGIGPGTIDAVLAAHPAIVVVGSAITGAADPVAAARELHAAIERFDRASLARSERDSRAGAV